MSLRRFLGLIGLRFGFFFFGLTGRFLRPSMRSIIDRFFAAESAAGSSAPTISGPVCASCPTSGGGASSSSASSGSTPGGCFLSFSGSLATARAEYGPTTTCPNTFLRAASLVALMCGTLLMVAKR